MSSDNSTLVFHRSLYLPEAVQAAAEVYAGYANVKLAEEQYQITVELSGFDPRYGDALTDAFSNHVLFETIVRSRETLGGVPV